MAKQSTDQTETTAATATDLAALQAENAALKAQMDSVLDALIEQRDEMDRIKAGAQQAPAPTSSATSELDAELAALKQEFGDYPLIQVFEQRALVGMDASMEIRLKDEQSVVEDPDGKARRWKLRWFNFAKEGRAQQAAAEGYEKVRWEHLADQEAIIGARMDEFVRKGERGLEVLHRMPLKLYAYKKKRDAASKAGILTSESRLKDMMANRVAGMEQNTGGNGDQAGTAVQGFDMTITPQPRETVTL